MSNSNNKSIVIFADGTGNKGGYTPDSNVYKTYNGIELHTANQISHYDNGVGTSANKIWHALSGAFGFGFQRNVRDLYRFLAMNYEEGDKVYLFGFSRGAATVRAFLGFIHCCGLVKGKNLSYKKLEEYTEDAFIAYRDSLSDPKKAERFRNHKNSHNIIDIHFVGVWDTVSALGLSTWFDRLGFVSTVFDKIFKLIDSVIEVFWKHRFYQYELTNNIKNAYQALALDDARSAFKPMVWDEKNFNGTVEQVWFAGMHSNVGGGYKRQGLANVALYWMLLRAADKGLVFRPGFVEKAMEDANVNGRLYDSRDGLAALYPFHPREIEVLCFGKLNEPVKIHDTVFDRIQMKTANYAPLTMPDEFLITQSELGAPEKKKNMQDQDGWSEAKNAISRFVFLRKVNYVAMFTMVVCLIGLVLYTWGCHIDYWGRSGMPGFVADMADYLTPAVAENLVELSIMRYPGLTFSIGIGLLLFWRYTEYLKRRTLRAAVKIRKIIISQL